MNNNDEKWWINNEKMNDKLYTYPARYSILCNKQFGCWAKHSAELAITVIFVI